MFANNIGLNLAGATTDSGGKIIHVGFDDPPRLTSDMTDEEIYEQMMLSTKYNQL